MRNFQDTFETRKAINYRWFFNLHDCTFNVYVFHEYFGFGITRITFLKKKYFFVKNAANNTANNIVSL